MPAHELLVEVIGATKDYRGLRPLRIARLELWAGRSVALLGVDQTSAEVLVNLVTGAMVPDAGVVRVMGASTTDIPDADAWLQTVDHFGLLSERAVLIEQLSVEQNLAVPFSLELDELTPEVRERVQCLADEVGLSAADLSQPVGALSPAARIRVRLGRALALAPRVLLAEHPSATLPPGEVAAFAADLAHILGGRGMASLVMTADPVFARAVAEEVLTLQPATGELRKSQGWRRWFS